MPEIYRPQGPVWPSSMIALSEREIRQHLTKVLPSPSFDATPRMRKLLTIVIDMTVTGCPDALKGYTIAREVYGRMPNLHRVDGPQHCRCHGTGSTSIENCIDMWR
jgi:hypothetical protein